MSASSSHRPALLLAAALITSLALPGCAAPEDASSAEAGGGAAEKPHGYVEGADEMPEAQLHLTGIDRSGAATLVDLLDETSVSLGSVDAPSSVSTDGRFVFASSAETGTLTVLDSGAWTVDHQDHVHYYSAQPRRAGTVTEQGEAVVEGGPSLTGVWFGDSGVALLLDSEALGRGEIVETARLESSPHTGMVVPFSDGALATVAGSDGLASGVRAIDRDGEAIEGLEAECAELAGSITTNVGVVFGCADGALLATSTGDGGIGSAVDFEKIPYPQAVDATDRATDFDNRRGRPIVAAVSGDRGAWLLDTRARRWSFLPTEVPLARVVAASDSDDHTVALARDGRVLLLDPSTGAAVAATEPLAATSLADPALAAGVTLQLDADRVYLNAPAEGVVYELDYGDGLRVARTLTVGAEPAFLAETGR
ncbi:ABC transporter [Agreia sp. PsM10]|uniref:ABC transporter n=1 Tax=Agreia sp. PsM10 TaxID=3030533 RepID=UPI00263A4F5E|nr:ABC transporter [Agreia sp. PsM10]MDN4640909.1 ABC transporter [Agreia sp. PsM10]